MKPQGNELTLDAETIAEVELLMSRIDRRYHSADLDGIEDLEEQLERRLERLDCYLEALAEDFDPYDDCEPDADFEPEPCDGVSIDEQLVAAWVCHQRYSSGLDGLGGVVRSILERERWGDMYPSDLRPADDRALIALCRETHEDEAQRRDLRQLKARRRRLAA